MFVLDGGPEGGALDQPYANDPTYTGHLNWEPDDLLAVMSGAVQSGWRVGTHAIGDRAVRTLLDVYERIATANPELPPGTLVIEHAFLADKAQRTRAIKLGVAITVQHALLHALGGSLLQLWGPERTRAVMPVKSWLDEGAQISAGTDYPIGFYEPIRTLWGMVTRATADVGIQGPEQAVDLRTAVQLSTRAGAALTGDPRLGVLQPSFLADIVGFSKDPFSCPVEELPSLAPSFTLIGGRPAFDPEARFS
jgi:predicted amidohydrolase YtcJ